MPNKLLTPLRIVSRTISPVSPSLAAGVYIDEDIALIVKKDEVTIYAPDARTLEGIAANIDTADWASSWMCSEQEFWRDSNGTYTAWRSLIRALEKQAGDNHESRRLAKAKQPRQAS